MADYLSDVGCGEEESSSQQVKLFLAMKSLQFGGEETGRGRRGEGIEVGNMWKFFLLQSVSQLSTPSPLAVIEGMSLCDK